MGSKQQDKTQQPLPAVEETKEVEATSDDVNDIEKADSSSPDLNQSREKKKRMKKRRQQRKNFDEDSSSLSSNNASPMKAPTTSTTEQVEQKDTTTTPSSENQITCEAKIES